MTSDGTLCTLLVDVDEPAHLGVSEMAVNVRDVTDDAETGVPGLVRLQYSLGDLPLCH